MSEKTSINIRIINRQRDTLFSFEIPLAFANDVELLNQEIESAFQQNNIEIEDQAVDGYEIDVFSGLCCDDRQIISKEELNI
jgi:CYTH domain-containing protein